MEEYKSVWADSFNELKSVFELRLENLIISIEHVGSTSVEGLVAKPIIDLDIIVG